MNFLELLQTNPIAEWIGYSNYGFYITLSGHAIGMATVVGAIYILAARILGFARTVPIGVFHPMVPIAWLGFALNAITGLMLFTANGPSLVANPAFLLKLALIAAGGVLASLLWRDLSADVGVIDGSRSASLKSRAFAGAAVVVWTGAIIAGRLIAYTNGL